MSFTLCLLLVLCPQEPRVIGAEALGSLDVLADAERALAGRRLEKVRIATGAPPALLPEAFAAGVRGPERVEATLREVVVDAGPLPALLAAARAFGVEVAAPTPPRVTDARSFEDLLERVHREVLQAIGSGRDPKLQAPTLHGLLDRALHTGGEWDTADVGALRDVGARLAKVDHRVLVQQAALVILAVEALLEPERRAQLARLPAAVGTNGVVGSVLLDRSASFGRLVIGGPGPNEYACDQIAVIVDLGGDDTYRGPAGGAGVNRRLSVVVDVSGNDRYVGGSDALGSATLGVGVLLDLAGADEYAVDARSAGFGAGGIGLLADLGGRDSWKLARDGGGVGCCGLGLLLDLGVDPDVAAIGPRCLGVGLPGGLGFYLDAGGDDRREALPGARAEQVLGVGLGLPPWLGGGAGLAVDLAGDDEYRVGGRACGMGEAHGLGAFFDAAGKDRYAVGAFALGAARSAGIGVCIDAAGDDEYVVTAAPALGAAVESGLAWAEDRGGDDRYTLPIESAGFALAGGLGVFLDWRGRDAYSFTAVAHATAARETPRAVALGVFADLGAAEDAYEPGDTKRPAGNGRFERGSGRGVHGEVISVIADR